MYHLLKTAITCLYRRWPKTLQKLTLTSKRSLYVFTKRRSSTEGRVYSGFLYMLIMSNSNNFYFWCFDFLNVSFCLFIWNIYDQCPNLFMPFQLYLSGFSIAVLYVPFSRSVCKNTILPKHMFQGMMIKSPIYPSIP